MIRADKLSNARPGEQGASVLGKDILSGDLTYPIATVLEGAVHANHRSMLDYLNAVSATAQTQIVLAPHAKTTMSPELIKLQLDGGCWGATVATVHQLRVVRDLGIDNIIWANQVVNDNDIDYLLHELRGHPRLRVLPFVDSAVGVERLSRRWVGAGLERRLGVLLEMGYVGGRCGVRSTSEAIRLAATIHSAPGLRLAGIAGYEGLLQHDTTPRRDERVNQFLTQMAEVARRCDEHGYFAPPGEDGGSFEIVLTAGGSAFFDLVVKHLAETTLSGTVQVVVRSGCYLTHDTNLYETSLRLLRDRNTLDDVPPPRFAAALAVWATVLSTPEPGYIIVGAGRRDFGDDARPPDLTAHARGGRLQGTSLSDAKVIEVNDQHCIVHARSDDDIQIGDLVQLSPSHPCTTFDKWRKLALIDDTHKVIGELGTYF